MLTQVQIEEELIRLKEEMLGECLEALRQYSMDAAHAEVAYKVQFAKALLSSKYKTVGDRNADATIQTEKTLFDRLVADRAVTTAREKLSAYRASIDALRTLMVGLRENIRG